MTEASNIYDEVRDKGSQIEYEDSDSGQAATHFEVLHFCCKSKNTCSTPHGPFTFIVLLGIKPWVQKLEEEDSKRRGPVICVPENKDILEPGFNKVLWPEF